MTDIRSRSIESFLAEISSASPTPGGGSVAALCAAAAAALGLMVCAIGSKKRENASLSDLASRLVPLKETFLDLASQDEKAYADVIQARRLPKKDKTRSAAIEASLRRAATVPLEVAEHCLQLLELLGQLAPLGSPQSVSDVGVAAILGNAALEAALLNVETNLVFLKDDKMVAQLASRKNGLVVRTTELAKKTLSCVRARMGS